MARNKEKENPLVSELKDRIDAGVEHHRPMVADTELTLAFLSGNQWVKSSQTRGIVPIENKTNELRDVNNQMLNHYRRWNHYLFQQDPVITAYEGGRELADAERAKVASSLMDFWEKNNGLREARQEATQWAGVTGIGYLVPTWRKNLQRVKRRTLVFNEEGEENEDGQVRYVQDSEVEETRSDLLVESYNPLQVYPFPLTAQRWSRVEGVMTLDLATHSWIRDHIDADVDEDDLEAVGPEEINATAIERLNRFVSPEFGLKPEDNNRDELYIICQWFERPTREHKDGRYVLMVGGQIVRDEKLPFVEEARAIDPMDRLNLTMGIIPVFPMDFPGKLIPPPPFGSDMRKAQVRINDILTDMRQNRKTVGRSKLLYEKGTLDEDQWTDEHGERIPLEPGTSVTPQVVQGQPLNGIDYEMQIATHSFEQQSGQTQVLQGQNPSQVRAAFHLDILREEAMTLMYQTIEKQEESYEVIAKLMLEIARQRYSPERIIEIYGTDHAGQALTFATAKINPDIRVRPGSMKPRNKAVTEAKLTELLQYGAFGQNNENIDQYWEMSELGTLNRAVDHTEKQRIRAENENTRMVRYQEVIEPWEHERHDIHIEEHLGYMGRPEWYEADEEVKQITLTHLEMHRMMQMAAVAPEAMQSTEPVPGFAGESQIPSVGGKGGTGASQDAAAVAPQGQETQAASRPPSNQQTANQRS